MVLSVGFLKKYKIDKTKYMHALKLETAGIQRYIFSSNKLKVNLGASYIIEHLLFKELLVQVLKDKCTEQAAKDTAEWFDAKSVENVPKGNASFKVGYIGGGNAVLYFGKKETLQAVESEFKRQVLQYFPGLEVYSGCFDNADPNATEQNFKGFGKDLNEAVTKNRSSSPFLNKTLNHGFYNSCAISGGVAAKYWKIEKQWVSDEVYSKVQYTEAVNAANDKHKLDLLDEGSSYSFPMNFENLSKDKEKAYIAVVHIDGNNLGSAFIDSGQLHDTQELSMKVREIGTESLRQTITDGILEKELYMENKALPIRPIITGGDDITFVCEGSLGVPLAKLFLEKFHQLGKEKELLDGNVHACAGVAIVKQKYPFYKAYHLSEELIGEAKRASRGKDNNGSYLSFMIAGYGTGSSLSDLKAKYAQPELFAQTYRVLGDKTDLEKGVFEFSALDDHLKLFKKEEDGQKSIPRNKLMEVRQALVTNQIEQVWPVVNSRCLY